MRKIILASAVLCALGTNFGAQAADMPVKAQPQWVAAVPAAYNWNGFYIGGHAGYGVADVSGVFDRGGAEHFWNRHDIRGGVWGLQGGFNWQTGNFVLGVEGDWSGVRWNSDLIDNDDNIQGVGIRDLASFRGRFGVAANNFLFYGTAGWGWGKAEVSTEQDEGPPNAATRTLRANGIVYGGGIEWAAAHNWILRVEYLRYAFGRVLDYPDNIVNDADTGDFFRYQAVDVIRVGLSYKFDWGKAPVMAKY